MSATSSTAMPTGDLAGWTQDFTDDFNGTSLDRSKWFPYNGVPGGDPATTFAASHVTVANGDLVVDASKDPTFGGSWVTGGINNRNALSQTYGKYLVRFRVDKGVGVPYALILWPTANSGPPEIDFAEDNGSDRQTTTATLHHGPGNVQIVNRTGADFSQWHVAGVEWTPGKIVYTLDGKPWATVTGANVPSTPMSLAIQTQTWACGGNWELCPTATTPAHVSLDVDWVVAYKMAN